MQAELVIAPLTRSSHRLKSPVGADVMGGVEMSRTSFVMDFALFLLVCIGALNHEGGKGRTVGVSPGKKGGAFSDNKEPSRLGATKATKEGTRGDLRGAIADATDANRFDPQDGEKGGQP